MDDKELELLLDSLRTQQGDDVDPNIIQASELEIGGGAGEEDTLYNNTPILNQSLDNTPQTTNGCGAYSQSKVINEMNFLEGSYPQNDCNPVKFWARTVDKFGGSLTGGSSIPGNFNNAKASGFLESCYSCKTVADIKMALANKHLICTGSAKVDWRKMLKEESNTLLFTDKPEFYHLFCIIGDQPSKRRFVIANSRGEARFDKGLNYVSYDDIDKLYTRVACIDVKDIHIIEKAEQDRLLLAEAEKEKIRNGQNADQPVRRYEVVLMAMRNIGKYGTDEDLLREARDIGIRTGENKYGLALRYEVAKIASRATKKEESSIRNGKDPYEKATRRQAVLMIMR